MPGLESLIRLTMLGLLTAVALPRLQARMQTQTQYAIDQMLQAQDLAFSADEARASTLNSQAPLPTVDVSQYISRALYDRLVSAHSS